jgi:hypothetical protein
VNVKKLAEQVSVLEKRIAGAEDRMNAPQVALAGMDACAKEVERPRPTKAERRAKLIAAHLALSEVRHELHDWSHNEATRTQILAAIGRLEIE